MTPIIVSYKRKHKRPDGTVVEGATWSIKYFATACRSGRAPAARRKASPRSCSYNIVSEGDLVDAANRPDAFAGTITGATTSQPASTGAAGQSELIEK